MELTTEQVADVTIVVLPGEQLDAGNAKEFKRDIAAVLEPCRKVVFDLRELRFVDSSGLGAILSCLRQLNAKGGDLKLCEMTKPVRALFELVRMHKIFDIYVTKAEALQALGSEGGQSRFPPHSQKT
jgi:anti-sigma B factor antagonist